MYKINKRGDPNKSDRVGFFFKRLSGGGTSIRDLREVKVCSSFFPDFNVRTTFKLVNIIYKLGVIPYICFVIFFWQNFWAGNYAYKKIVKSFTIFTVI